MRNLKHVADSCCMYYEKINHPPPGHSLIFFFREINDIMTSLFIVILPLSNPESSLVVVKSVSIEINVALVTKWDFFV